ncbi:4-(cytidine 5'-diphospho)-2-C-methyl-D-erythritol kinase [Candidatus Dependentiae bacterium]|nr:4-(cytidine 5'-diphospho)-2-C-methyl-D-erythritol kinase [Candidatus Dependentiae bacterium]
MSKIKAPAKVNLFLNVSGKDGKGFHFIETLFQTISIFDIIEIEKTSTTESELFITGTFAGLLKNTEDNLILKAVNLFFKENSIPKTGLRIQLEKNIPVSAGLGGGSSDAAAALVLLDEIFKTKLTKEDFYSLGSKLGSDINFFFQGGSAIGYGRGEKLISTNLDLDGYFIILYPDFEISARFAYENLQKKLLTNKENNYIIINLLKNIKKNKLFEITKNDLQDFLITKYPSLEKLTTLLETAGANISMVSGSGSCVFGYFNDCPDMDIFNKQSDLNVFLARKCWGVAKR